ncbi:hypothetical protein FACS1894152_8070 [Bacilli bacterium]|nr:hypothetical protein FACS1894152_8070 [Bacilli bacterium]
MGDDKDDDDDEDGGDDDELEETDGGGVDTAVSAPAGTNAVETGGDCGGL